MLEAKKVTYLKKKIFFKCFQIWSQKKAKKSQKFSKKAKLQYGTLIEEHDLPSKIFAIFTTLSIS